MFCSIAGAVYDVLGYVHPFMTASHNGMKFTTPTMDYDLLTIVNSACSLGGGWWYIKGSIWGPTTANPMWFSIPDATFYLMKRVHMMIKLQ